MLVSTSRGFHNLVEPLNVPCFAIKNCKNKKLWFSLHFLNIVGNLRISIKVPIYLGEGFSLQHSEVTSVPSKIFELHDPSNGINHG